MSRVIISATMSLDGFIADPDDNVGPPQHCGVPGDSLEETKLAALLGRDLPVVNYDRRGRGGSGDTAPHSVEREVDDLPALVEHVGASAVVFGSSSGAGLALHAAASGVDVTGLALFEPPLRLRRGPVAARQQRRRDRTARPGWSRGRGHEVLQDQDAGGTSCHGGGDAADARTLARAHSHSWHRASASSSTQSSIPGLQAEAVDRSRRHL